MNCKKCGNPKKDDQYEYCWDCAQALKQAKQSNNEALVDELSHINNNVYFIRRALAVIIRESYGIEIHWESSKKDFVEGKI